MRAGKRIMDLGFSICAAVALAPVIVLIAIAVKLEDWGPILFCQERLGKDGRIFTVYKFRKFGVDGNADSSTPTRVNDPRYSVVGKFLEKTKLNELPQLFNIIKGDMSLVGPRPEVPRFEHCYRKEFAALADITPGIFGPSQTAYRSEAEMYPPTGDSSIFYEEVLFPAKAKIDLAYYPIATWKTDLYWIYKSVACVVAPPPNNLRISSAEPAVREE